MTHKLSVHVGNRPTGLVDFETIAEPAVIYCLNNTVTPVNSNTITIRRIQNDTWGRLPDAMNNPRYFFPPSEGGSDAVAAARFELTQKTIYVPKHGHMNLLDYWRLGYADYYAPYNEPVLGAQIDHVLKARWLNDYTCEALEISNANGLRLCVGSFATANPHPDTWPALAPMVATCAAYRGLIDLHAYEDGGLMTGGASNALFYRSFHDAYPVCPDIVISEASSGNGYNTSLSGMAWVNDMLAYARELERDDYVIGACAFQLDQSAESHIDYNTLIDYAVASRDLVVTPPPPPEMVRFAGRTHWQYLAELNQYCSERGITIWFGGIGGDEQK